MVLPSRYFSRGCGYEHLATLSAILYFTVPQPLDGHQILALGLTYIPGLTEQWLSPVWGSLKDSLGIGGGGGISTPSG